MELDSTLIASRPTSFLLKGALLPMTVLEIRSADIHMVSDELRAKVTISPGFFQGSPIVFSFEYVDDNVDFDLQRLIKLCKELGLISTGIRGGSPKLIKDAQKLGLAVFPKGKVKNDIDTIAPTQSVEHGTKEAASESQASPESEKPTIPERVQPKLVPAKIIEVPVRSGQQVYAPGDMVIMASVSAGAELLAEGNIHIYGALRGRALAGVSGLESARVFCQSQEAELISIAGHFLIDEDLRSAHWGKPTQITYDGNDVRVKKLTI